MRALLILAFLSALVVSFCKAHDHMGMHSLFPPILENYWDNGLSYWSFGSASVVTDGMVRLTQGRPKSHGYLWNRHGNHLPSWRMNVTLQLSSIARVGGSEDLPDTTGVGVWFTTDTPRHGDVSFFGAPNRFVGLGITMDHNSVISIFVGTGYSSITNVVRDRKGFCRVNSKAVTITAQYDSESKSLLVGYHPEDPFTDGTTLKDLEEKEELLDTYSKKKAQNAAARKKYLSTLGGHCATLGDVELATHSYFGVTASNSASHVAKAEVQSFFVRPLARDDDDVEELVGLKMFDRVLDVSQRKAATGRDDVPLPKELEVDAFNFPKDLPLKKEKRHHSKKDNSHKKTFNNVEKAQVDEDLDLQPKRSEESQQGQLDGDQFSQPAPENPNVLNQMAPEAAN